MNHEKLTKTFMMISTPLVSMIYTNFKFSVVRALNVIVYLAGDNHSYLKCAQSRGKH